MIYKRSEMSSRWIPQCCFGAGVAIWLIGFVVLTSGFTPFGSHVIDRVDEVYLDSLATLRLTVDPHRDAIGTETSSVGLKELPGLKGYYLYVPQSCSGKKRCPLVTMLHGGGRDGKMEVEKFSSLSDKYGIILFSPTSIAPGMWDVIHSAVLRKVRFIVTDGWRRVDSYISIDAPRLDSGLKYILANYAINPQRLALVGFSNGGSYSMFFGLNNMKVFSRIAPLSALMPFEAIKGDNTTTQILVSGGVGEKMVPLTLERAAIMRKIGYSVKSQIGLRGHADLIDEQNHVWRWLIESWKDPALTNRESKIEMDYPVLTKEKFERVVSFYRKLASVADHEVVKRRAETYREVPFRIGSEVSTVVMADYIVLASEFQPVAKLLKEIGLTPQQLMDFRLALVAAHVAVLAKMANSDDSASVPRSKHFELIKAGSPLAKNMELLKSLDQTAKGQLERSGIFSTL